jgi:hypothetical protein
MRKLINNFDFRQPISLFVVYSPPFFAFPLPLLESFLPLAAKRTKALHTLSHTLYIYKLELKHLQGFRKE